MTRFRPCIDLHEGRVKQIVGGSLRDDAEPTTNFVAERGAEWFSSLYRQDGLTGGHVIQLGGGNEAAARAALEAWPQGMQLGGGITRENARAWLQAGARQVIVTSYLFEDGEFSRHRLAELRNVVSRDELVIDLSCRRTELPAGPAWFVATNRWQTVTRTRITGELLDELARDCAEFLVHAADVEGLCRGIDQELVALLGKLTPVPCTYAGGGRHLSDLPRVAELSGNRVDLTFGSALDVFGGTLVRYRDCVEFNRAVG